MNKFIKMKNKHVKLLEEKLWEKKPIINVPPIKSGKQLGNSGWEEPFW